MPGENHPTTWAVAGFRVGAAGEYDWLMTSPMPGTELSSWLTKHSSWRVESGQLSRTYEATTFLKAIAFVEQVAKVAESLDHHPDIDIRWRRVSLHLVTHDAGNAITEQDTRLAAECDLLFAAAT